MASMPAVTTQSLAVPTRHRLTVEDFHRMGEVGILGRDARAELIDGEIIDMSPIGRLHAAMVACLGAAFHDSLNRAAVIWVQNPIVLDEMTELQPDIALLAPRDDFYGTRSPRAADVMLVVEVADSSLDHDLGVKMPRYAGSGMPEVWVIDVATRETHRFRNPQGGIYLAREIIVPEKQFEYGRFSVTLANLLPKPA